MEILRQHSGRDRRDLRAGRRRRADRRHRRLRRSTLYPKIRIIGVEPEDAASMHESLRGPAARHARSRRHLRRRRRRAARRRGDLPARAALRRRDRAGQHRRDLRGDPGHLRGQPHDRRARRRAGGRGHQALRAREALHRRRRSIAINSGANINFDRLRHVAERADIGAEREALFAVEIPGAAGQLPAVLRSARPAQRHRVQLSLRRRGDARRSSSGCRCSDGRPREGAAADDGGRGRVIGSST